MVEFKSWGKTPRLDKLFVMVTEKLDGTNACVIVQDGKVVGVQSRNRMIEVGKDNFGFAGWVEANKEELSELGDGYHYGEWVGPGIQKNPMKLEEKSFHTFNTSRPPETLPSCVSQVPLLYWGTYYGVGQMDMIMDELIESRDYQPEGIIINYLDFGTRCKYTFDGPKWKHK